MLFKDCGRRDGRTDIRTTTTTTMTMTDGEWSQKLTLSFQLRWAKNMAARGRGLFSLYIYIENFKNLLVRKHLTDFNIILQKCSFGDPLPRLFKPFRFVKKHGRQEAGLIFPIYIHIENFKNLVRNHWTDFNIILQNCSFGNALPRLFKPFGFVKNHGHQGAGLIFPIYIFIENFKNLLAKPLDQFLYNLAKMFPCWSSTKIVQAVMICQQEGMMAL